MLITSYILFELTYIRHRENYENITYSLSKKWIKNHEM